MNADTKIPVQYAEALQSWLSLLAEDLLEKKVVKTDMKLRHIVNKGIEVKRIKSYYSLLALSLCNVYILALIFALYVI